METQTEKVSAGQRVMTISLSLLGACPHHTSPLPAPDHPRTHVHVCTPMEPWSPSRTHTILHAPQATALGTATYSLPGEAREPFLRIMFL